MDCYAVPVRNLHGDTGARMLKWRSIPPGLLGAVVVQIDLARVAKRDFRLALVDASAGAVAVVVPVPADVARAIGEAATLAARVERVGALVPAAQVLLGVA